MPVSPAAGWRPRGPGPPVAQLIEYQPQADRRLINLNLQVAQADLDSAGRLAKPVTVTVAVWCYYYYYFKFYVVQGYYHRALHGQWKLESCTSS